MKINLTNGTYANVDKFALPQDTLDKDSFEKILALAQSGVTPSQDQIGAYEIHKSNMGEAGGALDAVEELGMLVGFKIEFYPGFPDALKKKIEIEWGNCRTPDGKYRFSEMFDMTFADLGPGFPKQWGDNWEETLMASIRYAQGVTASAIGTSDSDEQYVLALLNRIQNKGL